jgi:hypothetical protein
MKKSIILLLVFFIGYVSYSQSKNKIKGNREVVEISNDVDKKFNALEIADNITVSISQGNKDSYVLNTDENLVEEVQFVVMNNVLKIFTSKKISNFKKLEVNLKVIGIDRIKLMDDAILKTDKKLSLDKILIEGNNSAKFDMELETDDLQINLYKNAGGKINIKAKNLQIEMEDRTDLKGKIDTDNLKVSLKNRAELTLSGDSKHSDFKLGNSSDLDAKKLDSRTAELSSSNTSDINIRASRKLEVNSDGRSKIYVYGKADVELKGFTDKSKIIKK